MASRQSQLHSYQFTVQRAVSALVAREPDPAQSPFRRVVGAIFASTMVAILALAAVGIYGLVVSGGNTTWKTEGVVIVDRDSGAKYVYLDGKLHPVLNFASALLIARSATPRRISVSGKSLDSAARGTPLGIPGAPDSLADAGRLLGPPWTVCSTLVRQPNGGVRAQSVLLVGARPGRGRVMSDNQALFVRGSDAEYMIWNSRKFRVPADDQKVVHDALVVRTGQVADAATAWLNSLPSGADLGRVKVPGSGGSVVSGFSVGDVAVVRTPGVGVQNYVALTDGLLPITQLQANLRASDHATTREESLSWYASQRASHLSLTVSDSRAALPEQPPTFVRPPDEQRAVCAVFANAAEAPEIVVDAAPPASDQAAMTGSQSDTATVLADRVLVSPGRGAVVEAVASPDAAAGTFCLITDLGTSYPVPSREVLQMLGYTGMQPLRLPAGLIKLLPQGRSLDPDAARAPAVGG
jgi:ESX secretion system ATPase EccB